MHVKLRNFLFYDFLVKFNSRFLECFSFFQLNFRFFEHKTFICEPFGSKYLSDFEGNKPVQIISCKITKKLMIKYIIVNLNNKIRLDFSKRLINLILCYRKKTTTCAKNFA